MPTQAERSEATRRALLDAATTLFAARGYADVSVDQLAAAAGVTAGALYHQYGNKEGLFRAVYEGVIGRVAERVVSGRRARAGRPDLLADCETYLDACVDPVFQRVVLRDAPGVLGWDTVRDDASDLVEATLRAARDAGLIDVEPVEPLARMLVGALKEAGFMIAGSADPVGTRAAAGVSLRGLIAGLGPSRR